MFQEFPKCLTRGEEWVVVFDEKEESVERSNGYRFFDEDETPTEPKRKPGRPPKAKE